MSLDDAEVHTNRSFGQRLVWGFLVVLVPLVATVIMVGVALQVVGVPVLPVVKQQIGLVPKQQTPSMAQVLKSQVLSEKHKIASLAATNRSLTRQIDVLKQQKQQEQAQAVKLKAELNTKVTTDQVAQQEALLLGSMDPSQAALVVAKMKPKSASAALAAMPTTSAASVLSAMDPKVAQSLLQTSAALSAQLHSSSGTATNSAAP